MSVRVGCSTETVPLLTLWITLRSHHFKREVEDPLAKHTRASLVGESLDLWEAMSLPIFDTHSLVFSAELPFSSETTRRLMYTVS